MERGCGVLGGMRGAKGMKRMEGRNQTTSCGEKLVVVAPRVVDLCWMLMGVCGFCAIYPVEKCF